MEKAIVIALLEKYWRAETTVGEEQALAAYFKGPEVDAELQPYSDLFAYFEEEAQVHPGPGFESRILQAITEAGPNTQAGPNPQAGPNTQAGSNTKTGPNPPADSIVSSLTPVRHFRWGMIAAAATVMVVVGSLFLLQPQKDPIQPNSITQTTVTAPHRAIAQVTDTYDNPDQALAAVRHALLIASTHLNEGRKQISNK